MAARQRNAGLKSPAKYQFPNRCARMAALPYHPRRCIWPVKHPRRVIRKIGSQVDGVQKRNTTMTSSQAPNSARRVPIVNGPFSRKVRVQRRGRLFAQHSETMKTGKMTPRRDAPSIAEQRRILLGFKTRASLPRRFSPDPGGFGPLTTFSTIVHVFFRIADEMSVGPITDFGPWRRGTLRTMQSAAQYQPQPAASSPR